MTCICFEVGLCLQNVGDGEMVLPCPDNPNLTTLSLQDIQTWAKPQEKALWKKEGCVNRDGILYGQDEGRVLKPCLPKHLF